MNHIDETLCQWYEKDKTCCKHHRSASVDCEGDEGNCDWEILWDEMRDRGKEMDAEEKKLLEKE